MAIVSRATVCLWTILLINCWFLLSYQVAGEQQAESVGVTSYGSGSKDDGGNHGGNGNDDHQDKDDDGVAWWVILLSVIGGIVGLVLITLLLYCCCCRKEATGAGGPETVYASRKGSTVKVAPYIETPRPNQNIYAVPVQSPSAPPTYVEVEKEPPVYSVV